MKLNLQISLLMILFFSWTLIQCTENNMDNERPSNSVTHETDYSVRVDSLFLGYYFGMTKKDFMDHSWQLNKEGIISGYSTIGHTFSELEYPALMEFFPEFNEDRIIRMPVKMEYRGWAPWNEHLSVEHLMKDLVHFYEQSEGEKFKVFSSGDTDDPVYRSIRGNREIQISKHSVSKVMVMFSDLSATEPTPE